MAQEGLELEPEVKEIFVHVKNDANFLLSGGAGSGKTYSLVQVIKEVILLNPTAKIACMTYTNAAVREIEEKINHSNLGVTTIHDFLWDNMKFFQKELKSALITLMNDETVEGIKSVDGVVSDHYYDDLEEGIQYTEWVKIKEGKISHDELLIVANYMFATYPKLCSVLKDKFKFIFIDEYQDTHPGVVEIFLSHLKKSPKKCVIGFFGDSMQSIYDDGVGDLQTYIESGDVTEVKKEQNRRNPRLVIELANRLRSDGLVQVASSDQLAPNMLDGSIIDGKIQFYHSTGEDIDAVRAKLGWDFSDAKETKELNLTHNLIAPKAGFPELMEIYDRDPIIGLKADILEKIKYNVEKGKDPVEFDEKDTFESVITKFDLRVAKVKGEPEARKKIDVILGTPANVPLYNQLKDLPFSQIRKIYLNKDSLIDDKKQDELDISKKGSKRDNLVKHLFKIQSNVSLYKAKRYNEFIRRTEYPIFNIQDKKDLKEIIGKLDGMSDSTIEEVIEFANTSGICLIDDRLNKFILEKEYLYDRVKQVKFKEFQNLFYYLEGFTPFSTQHKIKGDQFDNVLVILDNGNWNKYNFAYLFDNRTDKESVIKRTQKIFYVCCTRAKKELAVFYNNPTPSVIAQAKTWFGEANVKEI